MFEKRCERDWHVDIGSAIVCYVRNKKREAGRNKMDASNTATVGTLGSIQNVCDANPVRVIAVGKRTITVQYDRWTVVKGNEGDGSAEYAYEADPTERTEVLKLRKDGSYREFPKGAYFSRNHRRYYAPNF
jgi:hypothetical protein